MKWLHDVPGNLFVYIHSSVNDGLICVSQSHVVSRSRRPPMINLSNCVWLCVRAPASRYFALLNVKFVCRWWKKQNVGMDGCCRFDFREFCNKFLGTDWLVLSVLKKTNRLFITCGAYVNHLIKRLAPWWRVRQSVCVCVWMVVRVDWCRCWWLMFIQMTFFHKY